MLAEAYIENNEMRVINFPKNIFKGKHWKVNIEPIEEIRDIIGNHEFVYTKKDPMKHLTKIECNDDLEDLSDVKLYSHITDSAKYIHDLRRVAK